MGRALAIDEQLTVEEFLAFTEERPDGERWELIEGVAVLNASPTDYHQIIAGNLVTALNNARREAAADWLPLLGIGTRVPVSPNSLPQPDVMVKQAAPTGAPVSEEALVLFEIISRSNSRADQAWRRKVYASVPNCQHYVTVAQSAVRVARFDRASGWKDVNLTAIGATLDLPALGVTIPLVEIYQGTPLAP